MEQETFTPGRGTAESAAWFRAKLEELGIGQSELARLMLAHGDDRQFKTILRSLSRMASGDARVAGEMRALLGVLAEMRSVCGWRNSQAVESTEQSPSAQDLTSPLLLG